MPYMRIAKGTDEKWHKDYVSPLHPCHEFERTGDTLRIGGGRMCGNDEDSASEDMRVVCFPPRNKPNGSTDPS